MEILLFVVAAVNLYRYIASILSYLGAWCLPYNSFFVLVYVLVYFIAPLLRLVLVLFF